METEKLREFKPCVFFDPELDVVRVQLRDCSFRDCPVDKRLTLLRANYYPEEYVGFEIYGLAHYWGADYEQRNAILQMIGALNAALGSEATGLAKAKRGGEEGK